LKEYYLAQSAAAAAEAELKTAQGTAPGAARTTVSANWSETLRVNGGDVVLMDRSPSDKAVGLALEFLAAGIKSPPGSALDRLRGALDKPVRLDAPARPLAPAVADLFAKAGLDGMTARFPASAEDKTIKDPPAVGPLAGEHAVAAWLQLMIDDFNRGVAAGHVLPDERGKYDVYVREYGLLVTRAELAPQGALTLGEFARQARAEKARAAAGEAKKP
jgi:hypothetical protein